MIFAGGLLVLVDVSDSGCGDYLSDIANKSAARQARTQHTHTHTRTRAHTNTHEGLIQGMLWSTLASESRGVRAGSESLPSHTVQRGGGGRGCVATRSSWSRAGAGRCWIFCLRVGWGGGGEAAVGRVPHHLANGIPCWDPLREPGGHCRSAGAVSSLLHISFRGEENKTRNLRNFLH